MKRCGNCLQFKPLSDFYRKLERWQNRCKKCNAEVTRPYTRAAVRKRVLGESTAVALEKSRSMIAKIRGEK